jgi:hypothetical protein
MSTDPVSGPVIRKRPFWQRPEFIFAGAGGILVLIGICVLLRKSNATARPSFQAPAMNPMTMSGPLSWPGLQQPKTHAAAEAHLDDDALVLGVSAGGKHRAYVVSYFQRPTRLVIDDLLGDVPVTIAYSVRNGKGRVFTSDKRGAPLDIGHGGIWDGEPMLHTRKGGRDIMYLLESDRLFNPKAGSWRFTQIPVEHMTWKAWKEAHPDTDVFTGDGAPSAADSKAPAK